MTRRRPPRPRTCERRWRTPTALSRGGDYQEAQRAYEEVLRFDPGDRHATARLGSCYLKNRHEKKAEALLIPHLESDPGDVPSRLILARVLIRQGELESAAGALREVVRADPDNLMGRYNLGFVAYRLRRYDEALEHLEETIRLKPEHPEAHYTLGLVLVAAGRMDEGIDSLERAVDIDPRHVGARFNLVNACARAGRMRDAEKHQEIYAEISGRDKVAAELEAQIKSSSLKAVQHLLARQFPEALAEYQSLAATYPDYAPLFNDIGRLQLRLGRQGEAFRSLQKAVSLDPRLSEPHYLLANLYADRGDSAAAERERDMFVTLESIPDPAGLLMPALPGSAVARCLVLCLACVTIDCRVALTAAARQGASPRSGGDPVSRCDRRGGDCIHPPSWRHRPEVLHRDRAAGALLDRFRRRRLARFLRRSERRAARKRAPGPAPARPAVSQSRRRIVR